MKSTSDSRSSPTRKASPSRTSSRSSSSTPSTWRRSPESTRPRRGSKPGVGAQQGVGPMSNIQSAAEPYDAEFPEPEWRFSAEPAGAPEDNEEAERLNQEKVFNHDDDVFLVAWEDAVPANDALTTAAPDYASRYLAEHVK